MPAMLETAMTVTPLTAAITHLLRLRREITLDSSLY
jgi:hypothetical protein